MPEVQQATPRGLSRSFSAGIRAIASPRRHERRALDGSCFCAPRGSTRPPQRSGSRATTASPPGNEMGSWSPIRDGRGMKAFAALERGMRGLRDQAGCPCDAGRGKVRLVEGNENRVSKLPPPRMGPGGRAPERGPIPAGSRSNGRAGAQTGDTPLRGHEAGESEPRSGMDRTPLALTSRESLRMRGGRVTCSRRDR